MLSVLGTGAFSQVIEQENPTEQTFSFAYKCEPGIAFIVLNNERKSVNTFVNEVYVVKGKIKHSSFYDEFLEKKVYYSIFKTEKGYIALIDFGDETGPIYMFLVYLKNGTEEETVDKLRNAYLAYNLYKISLDANKVPLYGVN